MSPPQPSAIGPQSPAAQAVFVGTHAPPSGPPRRPLRTCSDRRRRTIDRRRSVPQIDADRRNRHPPDRSSTSCCAHVFVVHAGFPQALGDAAAAARLAGWAHVPHWMTPPQPSPIGPQLAFAVVHVSGMQLLLASLRTAVGGD